MRSCQQDINQSDFKYCQSDSMSLGLPELDDAIRDGKIDAIAGMLDHLELEVRFLSIDTG